ncbi:MAG: hypothetical protein KDK25_12080 [Leptospiraceae bacterium]|nr:hypothetical protein [Leptospiraceae bacterium]
MNRTKYIPILLALLLFLSQCSTPAGLRTATRSGMDSSPGRVSEAKSAGRSSGAPEYAEDGSADLLPSENPGSMATDTPPERSGPEEAVRTMHDALCNGDFDSFSTVVDMDRTFGEVAAAEIEDLDLSESERKRRIAQIVAHIKTELRSSLKNEDYSRNCHAEALLVRRDGNRARVISRLPEKGDRYIELEQDERGRWLVVHLDMSKENGSANSSAAQSAGAGSKDTKERTWGADPKTPLETARRLQDAACAGDADEFLRFMDHRAVVENSLKRMMERDGVKPGSPGYSYYERNREKMEKGLKQKLRQQIEMGKGGRDCRYAVRTIEEKERRAVVEVQLQGGRPSHLYMEKRSDGRWVIIQLLRPDAAEDEDVPSAGSGRYI